MSRTKRFLLVSGVIIILILGGVVYFKDYTKSFSPEASVDFEEGDLKIHVFYNSPSKKGRQIFGNKALVPYGKVWRTGANEATVFETSKDILFGEKILKAGRYSLWTIPGEQTWSVIFNSEIPSWGVDFNGKTNCNREADALIAVVPAVNQEKVFERFTISVEKASDDYQLILIWDQTLVSVPFSVK